MYTAEKPVQVPATFRLPKDVCCTTATSPDSFCPESGASISSSPGPRDDGDVETFAVNSVETSNGESETTATNANHAVPRDITAPIAGVCTQVKCRRFFCCFEKGEKKDDLFFKTYRFYIFVLGARTCRCCRDDGTAAALDEDDDDDGERVIAE